MIYINKAAAEKKSQAINELAGLEISWVGEVTANNKQGKLFIVYTIA